MKYLILFHISLSVLIPIIFHYISRCAFIFCSLETQILFKLIKDQEIRIFLNLYQSLRAFQANLVSDFGILFNATEATIKSDAIRLFCQADRDRPDDSVFIYPYDLGTFNNVKQVFVNIFCYLIVKLLSNCQRKIFSEHDGCDFHLLVL